MTTMTTSTPGPVGASPRASKALSLLSVIRFTPFQTVLLCVGLLTAVRLFVVFFTDINLGPDEAQYWSWSQDFAFGYFSKPPMLAWIIGTTTGLCGDTEACIRISSPLLHAGTSLVLFALGTALFGRRVGLWSALTYATLPAVWFSSGLITTDVPLLFFWSLTLLGLWRVIETSKPGWALFAGLFLGLALMSKYAAVYLILAMVLMAAVDKTARKAFVGLNGALVIGTGLVILSPNLLWNLSHDFATVSHTAANANWGGALFNFDKLLKFVGDQFGVFGPILMIAFLWGLFTLRKRLTGSPYRRAFLFLLVAALPPLLIVTVQSFISRANANWAATAYPAATILVTAWLLQVRAKKWLSRSALLHLAGGTFLYVLLLSPSLIEATGLANGFKRVRAWDQVGAVVKEQAENGYVGRDFSSVLVDDRLVFSELLYYARPLPIPLTMWDGNGVPENHFELNNPLTEDLAERALYVTRSPDPTYVLNRFSRVTPIGLFTSNIGGGRTRAFNFYMVEDLRP